MSSIILGVAILGVSVGAIGAEPIRQGMYYFGKSVSNKFSAIPYWESHAEPAIIRGSSAIVLGVKGFLGGLVSDNQNADIQMETFESSIKKVELETEE